MADAIHVLHVDDDPEFAAVAADMLEREDGRFVVETAADAEEGLQRLADRPPEWDCVVSDHEMPATDGIEFLEAVRERYPDLPFILFTGKGSEAVASEAIAAGVTDYLRKGSGPERYELLANRVGNAVQARRNARTASRQEQLMRLSEFAGDNGGWELDLTTDEVVLTDGARQLVGMPEDRRLTVERALECVHADDRADVRAALDRVIDTGTQASGTWRVRTWEGDERVVEMTVTPVTEGESEEVTMLRGALQDITERRERERELERERRLVERALDALEDLFYLIDADGTLRRWNDRVPAVTGYGEAELADRPVVELFPEDHRERVVDAIKRTLATGETTIEADVPTPAGRVPHEFTSTRLTDPDGTVTGVVGIGRDLSERRAREQRFRAFVEQSTDMISVVDAQGRFQYQSPSVERILGYEPEATVGDNAFEYIHPEDRERIVAAFDRALDGTELMPELEYRARHADGSWRWIEANANEQLDNPAVEGYVINSRDVTERKHREDELRRLQAQYRTLVENIPEMGVFLFDEDLQYTLAGGGELAAVGLAPGDFEGATPGDLFPPSVAEETERYYREALEGNESTFEQHYQDAWYRVRTVPVRDDDDGVVISGLAVSQNITDRRERERKLTALHDVVDEVSGSESVEAICERTVAASREILAFDMSVIDIERNGVLEKTAVAGDIPREDLADMTVEEGLAGKTYRTGESILVDNIRDHEDAAPQGPYRSVISVPIGEHGVFQAVAEAEGAFDESDLELADLLVSHAEGALDRLAREQQLQRQNDRLEEFVSVVSHDLRNPLNVAQGRLELASEDCDNEHLDPAARALDRGQALINDLLTLARNEDRTASIEPVALADLVEQCWQNVPTEQARLRLDSDRTVVADRSRLQQLFENLIRNAIEHGGDAVTVTVGSLTDGEDEGFYVADDGPGIPAGERERVFDAGYSTTDEGTGFGLRIVRQVCEAHGWTVTVTDSESGGVRFEFTGIEGA